ncbi:hypothetical protein Tco_1437598 [Tanacetum coccineum]
MEEDYTPAVQHQRRVNPKIHDVIKKEVEKLLEAGLIYPISDSPWVSPIHCVPKKGGMTVVVNEENELVPTRLVTGWRVCIDYRKLNEATRKDHFPLPFMDQMLERLAGNEYYCFLDGFSGYFQIPIDPLIKKRLLLLAHTERLHTVASLSLRQCSRHKRFNDIAPSWDLPSELMCMQADFAIRCILGANDMRNIFGLSTMLVLPHAWNKSIVHTDPSHLKYLFCKKDAKGEIAPMVSSSSKNLTSKLLILKDREPRSRSSVQLENPMEKRP